MKKYIVYANGLRAERNTLPEIFGVLSLLTNLDEFSVYEQKESSTQLVVCYPLESYFEH